MSASLRLQVLLHAGSPRVAGLPCAVRAAYRAGKELAPERVVIAGAGPAFLRRWSFPLEASGARVLGAEAGAAALDPSLPVLAVAADAFPDEKALGDFLGAALSAGGGQRRAAGRVVAAYLPSPAALGAGHVSPEELHRRALSSAGRELLGAGEFLDAGSPAAAAAAARILYSRLSKDNDGYIAKLDRRLSLAITRLLLPLPVTPNQVTGASLVIGLAGAWGLASPSPATQFLGALTLWFCCLLDGCDGEIARLKHHQTPWGGEFDLLADHVAHLATFVALPIGVARAQPGTDWRLPGALLISGFAACGYAVWKLVLSVPEDRRGGLSLVVERIASRDYVYLIVLMTALGRLDWFVWAAAVGSHAFWLGLVWLSRRERATPSPKPSESRALPTANGPS